MPFTFMRLIYTLFFAFLFIFQGNAQSSDILESFNEDWLVFDNSEEQFVPYLPSYHQNMQQLHLPLRLSDYQGFYLTIQGEGITHILLNNRLIHKFEPTSQDAQEFTVSIESWEQYYASGDTCLITLYANSKQPIIKPQAFISQYQTRSSLATQRNLAWKPQRKSSTTEQSTITLLGIGVMLIFAIFYRLPNIFNMPYLSRYLSGFTKIKNNGNRLDTLGILLFLVFYGLTIAYLFSLLTPEVLQVNGSVKDGVSLFLLSQFLQLFLWILAFLVGKFIFIWMLSQLYDHRRSFSIHIEEFVNIHQLYAIFILATAGVFHFSNILLLDNVAQVVQYAFWVSMLIGNLLVAYRINKNLPFRKVYLISYLCGTEFFPTLLLIKFLTMQ